MTKKVKDIGEQGLLERLQRFCPPEMIGDDAAVLVTEPEQSLVVTTDLLINGVHFSDVTTSPEDTGWRAAAANLSDLAAMGATPLGITVGLGLPGEVSVSWVERLYQGMTECLQKYNTSIVGGDVVRSPVTTLAITAFGQAHPHRIIRRSAAVVGDAIVVTGVHGASHAGLQLLLHPELKQNLNNTEQEALIKAHQRPQPRLDVLPILWEILTPHSRTPHDGSPLKSGNPPTRLPPPFGETPRPFGFGSPPWTETAKMGAASPQWLLSTPNSPLSVAGMDSSDGLADAILQICRASGVGAVLECRQIPLPQAFDHCLTEQQALEYALYGGEDFELVLCLPKELANTLVQKLGQDAAIVGIITAEPKVLLHDQQQKFPDQVLSLSQGFQHFQS
ncbi:thiamine-phosphate kinase [Nostoc sp. CENA67]|uniref:Thiamine-monophosphate kinase n=1 Tax=Amazonocrinis nigriterrae CENA67 TaxID=2794033 RepID=A0A8J7HIZ9_9NOST|nr:thiamine-phosphate kinase [Amazonocrinis nigriterrae]MBH8560632.1 thiamine-phosphate kinase [Amazonocrinis nigriterrae CENA67]